VCCIIAVLSLLGPRVAFLVTWLATNRIDLAFKGGWGLPLLGLIFFPWTVLLYTLSYAPVGGVTGVGWVLVGLGVLADLTSYISGPVARRRQVAVVA
jgi:hypothetical protein